jgi:hypothetical protein
MIKRYVLIRHLYQSFLFLLLWLRRKLLNDVIGILPSQRDIFGVTSSSENFTLAVAEVDGCEGEGFANYMM